MKRSSSSASTIESTMRKKLNWSDVSTTALRGVDYIHRTVIAQLRHPVHRLAVDVDTLPTELKGQFYVRYVELNDELWLQLMIHSGPAAQARRDQYQQSITPRRLGRARAPHEDVDFDYVRDHQELYSRYARMMHQLIHVQCRVYAPGILLHPAVKNFYGRHCVGRVGRGRDSLCIPHRVGRCLDKDGRPAVNRELAHVHRRKRQRLMQLSKMFGAVDYDNQWLTDLHQPRQMMVVDQDVCHYNNDWLTQLHHHRR